MKTYQELKQEVLYHNNQYYNLYSPSIPDSDYDALYDELEAVETAQGWADPNSPTNKVGDLAGKVAHPYKLYSLRKVYDKEEVDGFFDVKTPKIDGANITLVYRFSRLKYVLTRGNGEQGDNIIHLAKGIKNVPSRINTAYETVVINGECVTDNLDVDNFRNYVSGALGLLSLEEFRTRNISFIAHDFLGVAINYKARMDIVKNLGFVTVFDEVVGTYPQDGIVFRVNDFKTCVNLGYTSKYPKFAVALKPRGITTAEAVLQDVKWAVGRTGTVNPTGVISAVELDDAIITRVTLHNIGIIEENNLGLGDIIEIERAGGVIPKFIRVIKHSDHNIKIDKEHAEKALNQKLSREGPKLALINKKNANNLKSIHYFADIMEIKGLGPASIEKMGLTSIEDIYNPDTNWNQLGANGLKIVEEINKSRNQPYKTVLTALGIPTVGKSTAQLLVASLPSFNRLKEISIKPIKGIGPSTIKAVEEWLEDNEHWVENLPLNLLQDNSIEQILNTAKKICITGKLDVTRDHLTMLLEQQGYIVVNTVSSSCYALISGGEESAKVAKARQMGIPIINYWSSKKEVLAGKF